ncbi:fucose permease [Psychromicrobium silvestre]|uniref:Fucose permease n=2 Tax=Psychromicrobium silvestre TaxID=1645614 RepID=A0A7Y9S8H0_9MICC|nr:fucose permease [Psychromicrobium silvestre]
MSGIGAASWVGRIPAIRDGLSLTPATIGGLLLCMSLGSFASVSLSGLVVARLGARRSTVVGSLVMSLGLIVTGLGVTVFAAPVVAGIGLATIGIGVSPWNTASNVEGAALERALERHIMPRLHGSFSAGTVIGAALSALAAGLGLPVLWHLSVAAVLVAVLVWIASRSFQSDFVHLPQASTERKIEMTRDPITGPIPVVQPGQKLDAKSQVAAAWREPRTLLIGVLVLGLALAEGAAGDWVPLALADGYGLDNALGAVGYGVFVTAMTIGRFCGTVVLDRWGRVIVLRVCSATAALGLLLFVFAPTPWLAFAALVVWGLGSSLGFPVGMSAVAADDPVRAAARVSVVSTIGYGAFLCGPPLLGLLGEHIGILHSLLAVLVLIVVSFVLAPVTRKQEPIAS